MALAVPVQCSHPRQAACSSAALAGCAPAAVSAYAAPTRQLRNRDPPASSAAPRHAAAVAATCLVVAGVRRRRGARSRVSRQAEGEPSSSWATPSREQCRAVALAEAGHNVFITGAAGTGKTRALLAVISALRDKYEQPEEELAICGTTGCAASLIGGTTVHSFLDCLLGRTEEDFQRMKKDDVKERLRNVKTLIIDEVSMMRSDFFDTVSRKLSEIRRCASPFGGIQMILSGDFLQLPPVVQGSNESFFCFKAEEWRRLDLRTVVLRHSFRQQEDSAFLALLERMRVGKPVPADRAALAAAAQEHEQESKGVTLTCLRQGAADINNKELDKLGQRIKYVAKDFVELCLRFYGADRRRAADAEAKLRKCLETERAPKVLHLAVGARVVLLRNLRLTRAAGQIPLVNGTTGVVVGWFQSGNERLPKVEFSHRDCEGRMITEEVVVERTQFTGVLCGAGKFTREQLPLDLAWAVTIHKSQGMTLGAGGSVDLAESFTAGHVYTALSRFRRLSDLRVLSMPRAIYTSREALDFYTDLEASAQHAADEAEEDDDLRAQLGTNSDASWSQLSAVRAAEKYFNNSEPESPAGLLSTSREPEQELVDAGRQMAAASA